MANASSPHSSLRQVIFWLFGLLLLLALFFIITDHLTPNTSNAYLQAYIAQIAPQVSGRVVAIYVDNNSFVKKDTVLFQVDPRIYIQEYERNRANVADAMQRIEQMKAAIATAAETIKQREADVVYAQRFYQDMSYLAKTGASPILERERALDMMESAKALLQQARANYIRAQWFIGAILDGEYATVKAAKASMEKAAIALSETQVHAPEDGYITNMSINKGTYAHNGTPVLTFIAAKNWWVMANIKENNLDRIKPEQSVDVSINLYPTKTFHGRVNSIGFGVSPTAEVPPAYLPYIEKTADWIQLPQRFPVRIQLIDFDFERYPLRSGATVYVTIYTTKTGIFYHLSWLMHRIVSYWQLVS